MRSAFLTLTLGILVGFAAPAFMVEHHLFPAKPVPTPPASRLSSTEPAKPSGYPSPGMTLARLKKQFAEAVVVVLADESYDDYHQLIHVSVVEGWKGPAILWARPGMADWSRRCPTATRARRSGC